MTTSELQEARNQRGDVKVFAMDNTYGTGVFVPLEEDGIRFNKGKKLFIYWLVMERKKDKKKLFCKNIMCPCNNAVGDDDTASPEYYCLSGFCEYPSAWMEVEI